MKRLDINNQNDLQDFYRFFEERRITRNERAEEAAASIIRRVREEGDTALLDYTASFDHVSLKAEELPVSHKEWDQAMIEVEPELLAVLERAAGNIRVFHEKERERSWQMTREDQTVLGVRVTAVDRAGIYVPGGSAPLPSSVLMNAIPAKVAGVREIVMCTPPRPDGSVAPVILAAARIAGVDRVYKVGGAQAIAAMAYGTHSIPKVDKITGPGNAYVAAAKAKVYGVCGIDMIAGPSEILVVADRSARLELVAADLLSQAEHDPMAAAVLITTDGKLADTVDQEVRRQLERLERKKIAEQSWEENGFVILVPSLEQACTIADFIAPEHLELCVEEPLSLIDSIRHAGAVFCGNWSPEPMGDYYCGANHVLPTGGTARFSSPLGVWDFCKRSSLIYYSRAGFRHDCADAEAFARAEGLTAHAASIALRKEVL